jgi:hypothetical protein
LLVMFNGPKHCKDHLRELFQKLDKEPQPSKASRFGSESKKPHFKDQKVRKSVDSVGLLDSFWTSNI